MDHHAFSSSLEGFSGMEIISTRTCFLEVERIFLLFVEFKVDRYEGEVEIFMIWGFLRRILLVGGKEREGMGLD